MKFSVLLVENTKSEITKEFSDLRKTAVFAIRNRWGEALPFAGETGPVVRAGLWWRGLRVWWWEWVGLSPDQICHGPVQAQLSGLLLRSRSTSSTPSGNTASLRLPLAPVLTMGSHPHRGCQNPCLTLRHTEQAVSANSATRFGVPGTLAVPASDSVYRGIGDTVCRQHSSRLARLLNPKTKHLPP